MGAECENGDASDVHQQQHISPISRVVLAEAVLLRAASDNNNNNNNNNAYQETADCPANPTIYLWAPSDGVCLFVLANLEG
jgi:hypothetical protein